MQTSKQQMKLFMKNVTHCLLESLVVVTVLSFGLCNKKMKLTDEKVGLMIALMTMSLVLVDQLAPSLSSPLRQGLGFGAGACLVGFP